MILTCDLAQKTGLNLVYFWNWIKDNVWIFGAKERH